MIGFYWSTASGDRPERVKVKYINTVETSIEGCDFLSPSMPSFEEIVTSMTSKNTMIIVVLLVTWDWDMAMYGAALSAGQWLGLIGIGGVLWGAGVMIIRSFPQLLFEGPVRQLSSFILAFPMTYFNLIVSEMLLGIRADQRLVSTSIISAAALFLDGMALMWAPEFYENPSLSKTKSPLAIRYSRQGAAWLLWTFGVGFAIALYPHLK